MRGYQFARRAFLASLGGAVGFEILLGNLEAQAEGLTGPPRLLLMHWPLGTHAWAFLPNGGQKPNGIGSITQWSELLQPFADAGLQNDMTLLWGLKDVCVGNGAGGHEGGTPMTTTGADCPGTRKNGGEGDDGVAGGPSWDQILLTEVKDDADTGAVKLQQPGIGYANAICDSRVDSQETSTRCLSYGYQTQSVASATTGANITENVPLLPELKPSQLYAKLFAGFMPGPSNRNEEAALRALHGRKSVLDYCLRELKHLKSIAPASEAQKIDIHADVCRKIEVQVSNLVRGQVVAADGCKLPAEPDIALFGQDTTRNNDYANPVTSVADDPIHEQIGKVHAGILLAAMQCDLIRVGTFQWSPGTNHVSFKGLFPGEPDKIYMHHPMSHRAEGTDTFNTRPTGREGDEAEFLANVTGWYNTRTAGLIKMFKDAVDPLGDGTANMLDRTVIPYMTEVARSNHARDPKPAFIFGGGALGMQLGKYLNFEGTGRAHVDVWASIAQAFFQSSDPMSKLGHLKFGTAPSVIQGLWKKPGA